MYGFQCSAISGQRDTACVDPGMWCTVTPARRALYLPQAQELLSAQKHGALYNVQKEQLYAYEDGKKLADAWNGCQPVSYTHLFPTIYSSLYSGLQHMDENLKRVVQLYPESRWYLLRRVYLPLLSSSIQASLSNGISLTFKVGVMSEIMGQVPMGIGRQMNLCRLTSDMTGVFAWTG